MVIVMQKNKDWKHFFQGYAYASNFVRSWMQKDCTNDCFWDEYQEALNSYLNSKDLTKSVASRYASLTESYRSFLNIKNYGDENIATQLALFRISIELGEKEKAIQLADNIKNFLIEAKNLQIDRPFLAPSVLMEQQLLESDLNEWLENSIKITIDSLFQEESLAEKKLLLSICIPTFNRCEKLRSCLLRLQQQIRCCSLKNYEIFISDNHSTDNTKEVIYEFPDLNIRYVLRDKNYGGFNNFLFSLLNGKGEYVCYVADDDSIKLDVIFNIISQMKSSENLVACFVPAAIYDTHKKNVCAVFGHSKDSIYIKQRDQRKLLDYILETHAYPEVAIYQADTFKKSRLMNSQVAYEAFTFTSNILDEGDIAFLNETYYYWHSPDFAINNDKDALNLGHINAMNDWDRFRGGLDFILSKMIDNLSQHEHQYYVMLTHVHAAKMLALAIRLRYQNNYGSLIDLYFLSKRLIGMGYKKMLPFDIKEIEKKF